MEEHSPWVSCFCSFPEEGHWQLLFWIIFAGCLYSKQPWDRDSISLWERTNLFSDQDNKENVTLQDKNWTGLLPAPLEDWGLLSSGFFSCDVKPQRAQAPYGLLFSTPMGFVGQGESLHTDLLLPAVLSVIRSGASDPGIWCSLQVSMKMRQTNFSACR